MSGRSCAGAAGPLASRGAFGQPHALVAEIGKQAVTQLGGAFDCLAVSMKPVAPFLGFGIRHPDGFSGASQISLANAHGADLVVVGMSFLELAHLATLQHQGLALNGGQRAHDLEAVAGSFQHEQVLRGGMLFGPVGQLGQRHLVKRLFQHGGGRRGALQQRGSEGIGVGVKANHPSGEVCICILVHAIAR